MPRNRCILWTGRRPHPLYRRSCHIRRFFSSNHQDVSPPLLLGCWQVSDDLLDRPQIGVLQRSEPKLQLLTLRLRQRHQARPTVEIKDAVLSRDKERKTWSPGSVLKSVTLRKQPDRIEDKARTTAKARTKARASHGGAHYLFVVAGARGLGKGTGKGKSTGKQEGSKGKTQSKQNGKGKLDQNQRRIRRVFDPEVARSARNKSQRLNNVVKTRYWFSWQFHFQHSNSGRQILIWEDFHRSLQDSPMSAQ